MNQEPDGHNSRDVLKLTNTDSTVCQGKKSPLELRESIARKKVCTTTVPPVLSCPLPDPKVTEQEKLWCTPSL